MLNKKLREQLEAFEKQCQENLDKGLTSQGFTKAYEGQSKVFYLNNIKVNCTVDYMA